MSGITVRTFRDLLRKKAFKAIGLTVAGLVALSMIVFFAYVPSPSEQRVEAMGLNKVVMRVGTLEFTEADLARLIENQTRGNPPSEYGQMLQIRYQTARQVGQELAMTLEVEKRGFQASRAEIEQARDQFINAQLSAIRQQLLPEGKGTDSDLDKALRERGTSLRQLREQLGAQLPEVALRAQVVNQKFLQSLREKYNPTDEQLRLMFENIYPARIFISAEKHKDKAQARAREAYDQLKAGKPFAEVVKTYSDDPDPIKKNGGQITGSGYYEILDQLSELFSPEFANQVMALKSSEYTEPTEDKNKSGYYIFTIAKREQDIPKDFNERKDQYREAFIQSRISREQMRVMNEAQKNFKPEFVDPLLAQYDKLINMGFAEVPVRYKTFREVDEALTPIVNSSDANVRMAQWLQIIVLNQLRQLANDKQIKDEKQAKEYTNRLMEAMNRFFNEGGESLDLRLLRAELLIEQKKSEEAVKDLEIAGGLVYQPFQFGYLIGISELYEKAGRKDLAQQTKKRADALQKALEEEQKAQQEAQARMLEQIRKQQEEEAKKSRQEQGKTQQPQQGSQPTAQQKGQTAQQGR